jgi:virulence-associated protein VagC
MVSAYIRVYTSGMASTAKVFWSGNSQAVRLPREFRLPRGIDTVTVRKEGDRIVLEPPRRRKFSKKFWAALGSLPGFKRPRQVPQRRGVMFP